MVKIKKQKLINNFPQEFIDRYKDWKLNNFSKNKVVYENLSNNGQQPLGMIISCCDSRVDPSSIFRAKAGEFFIHRNIANLIPPYDPESDNIGTSAAVEFAICVLKVSHIIVLGHSDCGGIKSGFHNCKGNELNQDLLFTNKWLEILKPAYNKLERLSDDQLMINNLEKISIINSINNLIDFPFVKKALKSNKILIHGIWNNIGNGDLEILNTETLTFDQLL